MSNRRFIPGERHHWWPISVSSGWAGSDGWIGRVDTEEKVTYSVPAKTARISDGHNIKLNSPWDTTVEGEFDRADSVFRDVINRLRCVSDLHAAADEDSSGFCSHHINDRDLDAVVHCIVSLIVRSPRFRYLALDLIEDVWGHVPKEKRKFMIAANIGQTFIGLKRNLSGRGKFLLLRSRIGEFIFGDGFYNNVNIGSAYLSNARILAPLDPDLAVLYVSPIEYNLYPKVVSLEVGEGLLRLVNETTQAYSRDYLFFRSEQPALIDAFRQGEYLEYVGSDPIKGLAHTIPGIVQSSG